MLQLTENVYVVKS